MLEYWKDGILGFGKLGFWFIGKIHLGMGGNMLRNENSPLKSTFHYSMCEAKTSGLEKHP
jgi:hypothetical protein